MDLAPKQRPKLDGVTMFRFVAAFYVFVFHLFIHVPANVATFLGSFLYNGAVGMSFFFVLSGFVLTYNYGDKPGENYFIKRLIRIYPAYLFCGILTYPLLLNQITPEQHDSLKLIVTNILFITATQSWFYTALSTWNFGGTWSVSVEMFFYAVFPMLLAALNSKNIWLFIGVAFTAAAVVMPVSMLYQIGSPNENLLHYVLYSGPIFRLPEFAMGMAAAKLMSKGFKINHLTMILVLAALFYALNQQSYGWMMHGYIVVPAVCAILIYVSTNNLPSFIKPVFKPLAFFGKISYSFYLMQIVTFMYIGEYKPAILHDRGFTSWLMIFLISTLLSCVSYYVFEKKTSELLLRKLAKYTTKRLNEKLPTEKTASV